jgi:hypothetical protein
MVSDGYSEIIRMSRLMHQRPMTFASSDGRHWGDGQGLLKAEPLICNLLEKYNTHSMLEVGAGRGLQLEPQRWIDHVSNTLTAPMTIVERFGLDVYDQFDPAVPGIDHWPDQQYDCTVCIWVVGSILDQDFEWWLGQIAKRTTKFCFICGQPAQSNIAPANIAVNDAQILDYHKIIHSISSQRTEDFYRKILSKYWTGPDLYYVHEIESAQSTDWMQQALISNE